MKARLDLLRHAWQARAPREQLALRLGGVALGLLLLLWLLLGIDGELARLRKAVPQAAARLQRMQDDVAEATRLRGLPAAAAQPALADALTASLRSHNLDLTVTSAAADRLQVRGSAAFDDALAWLADAQHDYRLRVATFSASRGDGGNARLDIVLVAVAQ